MHNSFFLKDLILFGENINHVILTLIEMASEIGKLPIDDIIAHYLRYNDINGAKSRPASTASSSLETKSVAAEKKNAHPVALPGHNPKFDASIHCMNCQTRKFKKGCLFK